MAAELHQFDTGTRLRATIKDNGVVVDLSGATTLQYIVVKPSGDTETWTCTLVTDGTDGKIQFTTTSTSLDESGYYSLQAYIEVSTNHWHTDIIKFRVYPNLS